MCVFHRWLQCSDSVVEKVPSRKESTEPDSAVDKAVIKNNTNDL